MTVKRTLTTTILVSLAATVACSTASAATRYAAPRLIATPGTAPCTNASRPCTITVALANAVSGDQVRLSSGNYTKGNPIIVGGGDPFDDTLTIPDGVTVYGASSTNLPVINVRPNSQAEAGVEVGTGSTLRDVEIRGTATPNANITYSLSVYKGVADRVRVPSNTRAQES